MNPVIRWWRSSRSVLLAGLVAGCAVAVAVGGYVATRPAEYQARFTLVATPNDRPTGSPSDLGSVAALVLPSLTEVSRSPEVLARVSQDVPGAGGPTVLSSEVATELVPDSGVARITVTASDPGQARALASSLASAITNLHLLAPVGAFRIFGPGPATQVAPDRPMGLGFGLTAGVIAGVLAGCLVAARNRAVSSQRQVSSALGDSTIPVFVLNGGRHQTMVDPLHPLSWQRVRLVPAGSAAKEVTARLAEGPMRAARDPAEEETSTHPVTLVAARGVTTRNELIDSYAAVRAAGSTVNAVLLA